MGAVVHVLSQNRFAGVGGAQFTGGGEKTIFNKCF
jgi:hypothetical protein